MPHNFLISFVEKNPQYQLPIIQNPVNLKDFENLVQQKD